VGVERFNDRRLPRPSFVLADQDLILPESSALSTTAFAAADNGRFSSILATTISGGTALGTAPITRFGNPRSCPIDTKEHMFYDGLEK
jgi:hypothetical protein